MEKSLNHNFILNFDSNIKNCIEKFNKNGLGFCVVVNKDSKVIGVITDGDLRRGLLNTNNIKEEISRIVNKKFLYLNEKNISKSNDIFNTNKDIKFIPVLSKEKKLIKILFHDQKLNYENIPVVIMAGGEGKRLLPLTKNTPKPMIKVGTKPLLEIIIKKLKDQGFKKIFISVNYKKNVIKNYFKKNKIPDLNINFIEEKKPLGTFGSLNLFFKKYKLDRPVLVLNSDLYTNFNFGELIDHHNKCQAKFTVVIRQYEINIPYGLINIKNNKVIDIIEKPKINNYVNSGIYVFSPELHKFFKKEKKIDANEFISNLLNRKIKINPFLMHESWVDIGNRKDLIKARSLNV